MTPTRNRLTYGATSYTVPAGSDKMSAAGGSSITYTRPATSTPSAPTR